MRGSCQKLGGRGAAGGEGWLFVTPPVWFRLSASCDGLTRLFASTGVDCVSTPSCGLKSIRRSGLSKATDTPHTQYYLHIYSSVVTKTTVTVLLIKM